MLRQEDQDDGGEDSGLVFGFDTGVIGGVMVMDDFRTTMVGTITRSLAHRKLEASNAHEHYPSCTENCFYHRLTLHSVRMSQGHFENV
eukprot:gene2353-29340_t